jgi:hypothetical protein
VRTPAVGSSSFELTREVGKQSMKASNLLSILMVSVLVCCGVSCKKEPNQGDAGPLLHAAFASAPPQTREAVATAKAEFDAGKYLQAIRTLHSAVAGSQLDDDQKQAIRAFLDELGQAVVQNPRLNTPEMGQLTSQLYTMIRQD